MRIVFVVKKICTSGPFMWVKRGEFTSYEEAADFIDTLPVPEEETRYMIEKNFVKESNKQKYCGAV